MDFGHCKKWLKKLVDNNLDHRCVIPEKSPHLKFKVKEPDNDLTISFDYKSKDQNFSFSGPKETLVFVDSEQLNFSDFTNYLETIAALELPERVTRVKFTLEEDSSFSHQANYRYTHGLKHHEGNCQRLLHGHRNPIEVHINGKKSKSHEEFMANYFDRVHFVPENSLSENNPTHKIHQRETNSNDVFNISYKAPQGEFQAQFPVKDCVVMQVEPSIESITELTWNILKREFPDLSDKNVVASCYEGLNKGCSFEG